MELIRKDRASLASPVKATIYEGIAARTHSPNDPLRYPEGPEYRRRDALAKVSTQLAGKPFLLLHPSDQSPPHYGLVSRGAKGDQVGVVLDASLVDDEVKFRAMVTDPRAVAAIDAGTHELSLGYSCRLDAERYQIEIVVDHLALVPMGRCGVECSLRADSGRVDCALLDTPAEACPCKNRAMPHNIIDMDSDLKKDTSAEQPMSAVPVQLPISPAPGITMDELTKKLTEALAEAATQKARADQLDTNLAASKAALAASDVAVTNAVKDLAVEKTRADKALEDLAAEKLRADKTIADAQVKIDAADATTFNARVGARVSLVSVADRILGAADDKGVRIDRSAISDRDLKIQIIKTVDGDDVRADAVEAYVDGVYEGAIRRHDRVNGAVTEVRGAIVAARKDGALNPKSAYEREVEANAAALKARALAWRQ